MIKDYCKKLKIGRTFYKDYKDIEAASNEEFLLKLLKIELDQREITRKKRLLKTAGFDVLKTFHDYSFDYIEIPKSITLETLKTSGFIQNKENLILYGTVGTGKTHLATAIGIEACNQGKNVKFYRTAALVNQLSEAKTSGTLSKLMRQIQKCDLLICDEWGYVPFEKGGAQLLFQVVSECYEKRSVIITTNLEFSHWNGIFFDEKMTSAIIDRLIHHSHLLVFTGPSYRLTHSSINC
ncbi:IS21-like element helper ATPase IstB [Desulfitobacterium sp. AusDCA]|uniref:IS21-like element helper ATPase IstB n=1 Tax=Desulfitobacterium sp. AusDCA TaxID=3240383 RepID=UPI003DA742A8